MCKVFVFLFRFVSGCVGFSSDGVGNILMSDGLC